MFGEEMGLLWRGGRRLNFAHLATGEGRAYKRGGKEERERERERERDDEDEGNRKASRGKTGGRAATCR